MSLPTHGRVVLETTVGEIEIELWSKETPKACRNFLTLAMEGYYDGVIFHRVVPSFLVQTGDRTGTGAGGESFYGEPFQDEIHPRLRFAHRGLVAMANNGTKDSNDSQFFITLDRADELHGKHTLFGRCVGDTIFNVLKIGELEIDKNGRPLYPPKIKSVRIIDNPYDDIMPRITAEEKRVQARAKEDAQRERDETARRKGAKKNVGLLSFGGDDGAVAGDEEPVVFKKKTIVPPDLIDDPSLLPPIPGTSSSFLSKESSTASKSRSSKKEVTDVPPSIAESSTRVPTTEIKSIREKHAEEQSLESKSRQQEIASLESSIRKLSRRRSSSSSDEEEAKKKKAKGPSILAQELAKYRTKTTVKEKGKKKDEGDVLAVLSSFRSKLKGSTIPEPDPTDMDEDKDPEAEGMEVDSDAAFLRHTLTFPKDDGSESARAEHDYEVIDPRERGRRAKEEEKEKRAQKNRGGRGRR